MLEDNCLESADFFLGSIAANLVRVPLYRRNAREGHRHMLAHTDCRAIVVAPEYLHEVDGLKTRSIGLRARHRPRRDLRAVAAGAAGHRPGPAVALDDLHLIRHSAGTTGRPKGIAFSHRSWMSTERDLFHGLPPVELGDRCQHAGPISHGSGYLFVPIWLGGGASILERRFDVERTLELLAEVGGYFFAVPTMLADLVAAGTDQSLEFPRLKVIEISAAPIRAPTALAAHELFGDTLYQFYGQTEAFPVCTWARRSGSPRSTAPSRCAPPGGWRPTPRSRSADEDERAAAARRRPARSPSAATAR